MTEHKDRSTDELRDRTAYGGAGWQIRADSLGEELGTIWGRCGISTEWTPLKQVLLHRPGPELDAVTDPDQALMLRVPETGRASDQHDGLARAYRDAGVEVHLVNPAAIPSPNLMFVADLMFMTPEGAILARPASPVRAGEERAVARRLADLGIPILLSVHGRGTFEGADAMWLDPGTVMLATGLRTNPDGADQVQALLRGMGIDVVRVGISAPPMHLMGSLRIVDEQTALIWPGELSEDAQQALTERGYAVYPLPDPGEIIDSGALNFVTIGPRRIVMSAGNPNTRAFCEDLGIECVGVAVDEILKAAGGIGCTTGIVERADA